MESALTFMSGLPIEEECRAPGLTQQHFDTLVAMALLCLQVSRRLYECLFVSVFSKSKMHFLHYVLGIYFYTALGPTALLHIAPRSSKLCYIFQVSLLPVSLLKKSPVFEGRDWILKFSCLYLTNPLCCILPPLAILLASFPGSPPVRMKNRMERG